MTRVPYTEILKKANCISVEGTFSKMLSKMDFHMHSMEDTCLVKILLYGDHVNGQ